MRCFFPVVLLCIFILTASSDVFAFGFGTKESNDDKLKRIERTLNALEDEVYKGSSSKISHKNKPYEQESGYSGGGVEIRISALESKLREITGKIEQSEFDNRNLVKRIEQLENSSRELDIKVKDTSANTKVRSDEDMPERDEGTQNLGTTTASSTKKINDVGPQYEYDQAFSLLRQAKYDSAAEAFHEFIKKYPKHGLVSNAHYWLGETFYVQKDYEQSSVAFLQGYQSNPTGGKAADNLLKLAISLSAIEKKKESCATFQKLEKEFPEASKTIQSRAEKEKDIAGCN